LNGRDGEFRLVFGLKAIRIESALCLELQEPRCLSKYPWMDQKAAMNNCFRIDERPGKWTSLEYLRLEFFAHSWSWAANDYFPLNKREIREKNKS